MPVLPIKPYWSTPNDLLRLYLGDVIDVLRRLPADSVHCVVTSPPYWGLRDYGTAKWEGGDPQCTHLIPATGGNPKDGANKGSNGGFGTPFKKRCGLCGALRVDNQIGLEETPQEFIAKMVQVFREVRRVLHPSGTLWLNLGDTYAAGSSGQNGNSPTSTCNSPNRGDNLRGRRAPYKGLPSGNLAGIPWRVALALQEDGWILRQDIIWAKPSPMPESVRNRCTKAHEYLFLFAKRQGYYYDQEAIKEKAAEATMRDSRLGSTGTGRPRYDDNGMASCPSGMAGGATDGKSNKRSVWSVEDAQEILGWLAEKFPKMYQQFCDQNKLDVWRISGSNYSGAHFATFPRKLVRPCILAGTSEYGCCPKCLAPWRRVTERRGVKRSRPNDYVKRKGAKGTGNKINQTVAGVEVSTLGWEPTCECNGKLVKVRGTRKGYGSYHDHNLDGVAYGLRQQGKGPASKPGAPNKDIPAVWTEYQSELPLEEHPIIPCTVLDPFVGSGTTLEVAFELGRRGWGIDLSEEYLVNNAIPRLTGALMERPALASQVAPPPKATEGGTDARVYD